MATLGTIKLEVVLRPPSLTGLAANETVVGTIELDMPGVVSVTPADPAATS